MNRTVLGIDESSKTGYAVFSDEERLLESGTEVFKGDAGQRFYEFDRWLSQMIITWSPSLLVYEKPHFRGYAATLSGVGLIALILKHAYSAGIPVIGVHTATLKSFATGYGKATKDAMTKAANVKEGLSLATKENNNEADAIHLALYGVDYINNPNNDSLKKKTKKRAKK